jgi:hypothetical protein
LRVKDVKNYRTTEIKVINRIYEQFLSNLDGFDVFMEIKACAFSLRVTWYRHH